MKDFERDYRKWSRVALISIVVFLFSIAMIDAFLGFDFSRNMYVMSIVTTGCVMALISLSWIRILNCKLMRSDLVKPITSAEPGPTDNRDITSADIERCIRKEGYVPQNDGDRTIFKIGGEVYEVYYENECFTMTKRFTLGEDVDKTLMNESCSKTQDEIFMFRSYIHTYDDGKLVLCFEVETYLSSAVELEKHFPHYLNVLLHAVDRQKEIYFQINETEQNTLKEITNPTIAEPRVVS